MGRIKKLILVVILGLWINSAEAGEVYKHNFYNAYDPAVGDFVYNKAGAASTGDQVAVNTYLQKTIQITGILVNEDIEIRIEGRCADQRDGRSYGNRRINNWAVLDTVNFGSASQDSAINTIIDVTEYVEFLRVGIRNNSNTAGTSYIDVEGIFTNLQR